MELVTLLGKLQKLMFILYAHNDDSEQLDLQYRYLKRDNKVEDCYVE